MSTTFPSLSITGKADTRRSTNLCSAVITGVSGVVWNKTPQWMTEVSGLIYEEN
jgi:hypothetical protein